MDMQEETLFSIIIPVYNTGKYLKRCFESVLNQSYKNWEAVIVDDGSTDRNTIKICDEYAVRDGRFRVFHKSNEGLLATRVFGRKQARGEYYCNLDSDDYWNVKLLEKVHQAILDTECDLVLFRFRCIGTKRNSASPKLFKNGTILTSKNREELVFHLFTDYHLNHIWLKVAKSSLFNNGSDYTELMDVKFGEDLLQSVPILLKAKKIYYLNNILYYYCYNPESITKAKNSDEKFWMRYNNSLKVLLEILRLLKIYVKDEEMYLPLCYKNLFKKRVSLAKEYIKWENDFHKRKVFLNALFNDDMMHNARKYINEGDYIFYEKKLCRQFKNGTIIEWMLRNEN